MTDPAIIAEIAQIAESLNQRFGQLLSNAVDDLSDLFYMTDDQLIGTIRHYYAFHRYDADDHTPAERGGRPA